MAIVAGGGGALLLGGALLAWRFTVIRGRGKGALDGVAYYPKVATVGEVSASDAEAPMGGAELSAPEPCPEQAEVMSDPESPEATIAI